MNIKDRFCAAASGIMGVITGGCALLSSGASALSCLPYDTLQVALQALGIPFDAAKAQAADPKGTYKSIAATGLVVATGVFVSLSVLSCVLVRKLLKKKQAVQPFVPAPDSNQIRQQTPQIPPLTLSSISSSCPPSCPEIYSFFSPGSEEFKQRQEMPKAQTWNCSVHSVSTLNIDYVETAQTFSYRERSEQNSPVTPVSGHPSIETCRHPAPIRIPPIAPASTLEAWENPSSSARSEENQFVLTLPLDQAPLSLPSSQDESPFTSEQSPFTPGGGMQNRFIDLSIPPDEVLPPLIFPQNGSPLTPIRGTKNRSIAPSTPPPSPALPSRKTSSFGRSTSVHDFRRQEPPLTISSNEIKTAR